MSAIRIFRRSRFAVVVAAFVLSAALAEAGPNKLDKQLDDRSGRAGSSRVIISLKNGADASSEVLRLGGRSGRRLRLINGLVAELPNAQLKKLAQHPAVERLDHDRPTSSLMATASAIVGARTVQQSYGLDGAGVGVAVIDSGVTAWHDDLTYEGSNAAVPVNGGQRVSAFVDFVNDASQPYDDNGHGTHVSGIIAGNGYDSRGSRSGIAPASHIMSLKVLNAQGRGVISDVIAALDYAVVNRVAHNIRVINLSVGAAVTTSYQTDPLTIAAKRAVDAGIVVVTAAGNLGRNQAGAPQYGGITAPGNAPWVLTVGAFSHQGTLNRRDDSIAPYSSRGPAAIDYAAKPDITAPGTGIVSLSDPSSTFYRTKSAYLLNGSIRTAYKPYLSLTGTSMAAPVVSGTVALMIQANPNLTPNLVKAILQYTAQVNPELDPLTQGGGFLNTKGAVDLARYFAAARDGERYPRPKAWSGKIHWGNRRLSGGAISPFGNAWDVGVVWGVAADNEGDNIVWGTVCKDDCFNIVWGTASNEGDNIVWGTSGEGDNIVWGTSGEGDNIVWGTSGDIRPGVWGSSDEGDNIVWGTSALDGVGWTEVPAQAPEDFDRLFDPPTAIPGGSGGQKEEAL
ncbi:MAG: S8 family peptidase [Acidobacteria bacterium]|nr:S8 family peptidase [Acidobacteriota bacterium]